ncbi:MAG: sigma-70 family RNA polymerase sigma factor [Xanthomonadales bacterium]|nr:sigma-70 family RNA polymerase sigma factor [Gammaproteobacteria bacterium]MBT8055044.1 sigma-70 family RNA polymerase sigma factor [Gammaproteobacteria bacterium]NND57041.1 sigma-70 family RNA polymerase sigma factor [Xanthomonadales bacterium]
MNDPGYSEERQAASLLVSRVKNGEPAAEAAMVERYSRGLRFLLRRKTRDTHLSEDLLQETWAIALVKIRADGLDNPGRLAGYLSGIANNLALGEARRAGRQRTTVNSDIVDLIPDSSSNPFRTVSRAEVCIEVRKLLDKLKKERDREILKRFYVWEEDKESICRRLGVDGVHFNRVLFRARQRLKSAIEASDRRKHFKVVS